MVAVVEAAAVHLPMASADGPASVAAPMLACSTFL